MRIRHTILLRHGLASLVALALLLVAATPAAAAPSNDDIANASPIAALPFSDALSTADATTEAGDPDCAGNGPTVWYAVTLAVDTPVLASTFGSDYDTTLSAYSGSPGALSQIACNDDAGGGVQSQVGFNAAAGVTYYLMVGAYSSGAGGNLTISLDVAPPPLEIDVHVNSSALVVPKTGVVTLSGTITCSQQAFVDMFSLIQLRSGRATIRGFGFTQVDCNGTTNWSMTIFGENGHFAGGRATFDVFAQTFDSAWGTLVEDSSSGTVTLRGSR